MVRCAIRCEKFQLAVELAEKLLERYPNVNSKILLSLSCAYRIHQEINGRHYWLIEKHLMEELDSKIQDCLVLAKKSSDNRIVHISSVLLSATYFQSSDLLDICNQNIEEAKKVFPQIEIYLKNETDDANKFRSVNQILSANDLSLNEDDFAQVCSALFSGKITNREVKKWLTMGGDVSASDHQLTAFMRITLKSVACNPDDSSTKVTISEELDDFLKTSLKNIHEFNTFFIYKLCKRLNQIGLSLYVVQLIEPLLPNTPWASPIIDVYSQALLWSDKLEKLDKLLNKMEGVKDSYILLAVKIEKSCKSNDFIKAIELTEFALEKYNNSCYYWGVLLRILHLSNSTPSEKISAIKRIPSSILDTYSEEGLRLLNWIANSDLLLAESMILEWFIDDPVGMATHITNLHFNNIDRRQTQKITNYSSSRCSEAIVYKIGKQQYTKLLVENCKPNEHLLDVDTPLGTLLKNADIGEDVTIGITTYTIVEKIAPIVGAFRIAINIRHDINSGTDCFYRLTIEDDSIDSILNQIDSMSKQQQLVKPEIEGKIIPLLMRLHYTHPHDLVRGSLRYLTDKESNKSFQLFSNGETIKQAVVLDILSLAYLSLTGFCHGLIRTGIKIYITIETHEILSGWLEQIGRPDFLSIAKVEGGFIRTTAEDIAKDHLYKDLRILLNNCELLHPTNIDMPEMVTKIRDIVDISHYSSLKASISNAIPFLCLDVTFCNFYHQFNVVLANAYQLMVDANSATSKDEKYNAECHIQYGLIVPLTHKDVIELCSQKGTGQYLAAEIIKMHLDDYQSSDIALSVLSKCCLISIYSAYLGVEGPLSLSEWRYTEHVVYACCESAMWSLEGDYSEQRIALLISEVFKTLSTMNGPIKLALTLFRAFVYGHFLDIPQIDVELKAINLANNHY